jgi:predicted RNase H-like nuclease (RuvC/YqgF family)
MLHLAQVQNKNPDGKATLRLLAFQKSEHLWALVPETDIVHSSEQIEFDHGTLVLVELTVNRLVKRIRDATPWIVEVVEQYLTVGITPSILRAEVERAEQWRQSLTLQSQEIGRRALEVEARRDQIQELEEYLKQEKRQLQDLEAHLQQEKQNLARMADELGVNVNP